MSPWERVGRARRQVGGDGIKIEIESGPLTGPYWITRKGIQKLIEGIPMSFGTINPNGIFVTAGEVCLSRSGKMLMFYPNMIGLASRTGALVLRKRERGDGAEWQIPVKDIMAHYGRRDPEWVAVVAPSEVLVRWGVQAHFQVPAEA